MNIFHNHIFIFILFLTFPFTTISISLPNDENFCYNDPTCGPDTWGGSCQTGTRQSPINLDRLELIGQEKAGELSFSEAYSQIRKFTLTNDHLTTIFSPSSREYFLSGPELPGDLSLLNFHFHWGQESNNGSEHTLNERRHAMELHLVHTTPSPNPKYVVIAVLFSTIPNFIDHPGFESISGAIGDTLRLGEKREIELRLADFLPDRFFGYYPPFFRYSGSLTTPGCDEGVIWNVYDHLMYVDEKYVRDVLRRKVLDKYGEPIQYNIRPLQPIGGREISYYESRQ